MGVAKCGLVREPATSNSISNIKTTKWWAYHLWAGGGILKLYDDVQMCGYQDVQVMWEILTKTEMETSNGMPKQRRRSLWRLPSWYGRSTASSAPIQAYE
ncbi:hypothetical protein BHM03_00027266 [Ensete ventricosum]|nr:hypothetical protein BHM03_00027266 [Ensete ventricosum]